MAVDYLDSAVLILEQMTDHIPRATLIKAKVKAREAHALADAQLWALRLLVPEKKEAS